MERRFSSLRLRHCARLRSFRKFLSDSIEVKTILSCLASQLFCKRLCPLRPFAGGLQLCLHVRSYAGCHHEPNDHRTEKTSNEKPHTN